MHFFAAHFFYHCFRIKRLQLYVEQFREYMVGQSHLEFFMQTTNPYMFSLDTRCFGFMYLLNFCQQVEAMHFLLNLLFACFGSIISGQNHAFCICYSWKQRENIFSLSKQNCLQEKIKMFNFFQCKKKKWVTRLYSTSKTFKKSFCMMKSLSSLWLVEGDAMVVKYRLRHRNRLTWQQD